MTDARLMEEWDKATKELREKHGDKIENIKITCEDAKVANKGKRLPNG